MAAPVDQRRRDCVRIGASVVAAAAYCNLGPPARAEGAHPTGLGPLRRVLAGELEVGLHESGPLEGLPVFLLHGFPYSVHAYESVAPLLASRGCRVIVPHLRGHGPTRIRVRSSAPSGQQAALGADLTALMDTLGVTQAVFAGYDWGGRAACVAAALWPERCAGLVSVNGYLIQDIANAGHPLSPPVESGLWYQYYFQTERGRIGLEVNRAELARTLWTRNSPNWRFDASTFGRSASVFENPDFVEVVIHSYRHRLGLAAGMPQFTHLEQKLARLPPIQAPAITLDGDADGVVPATDGTAAAMRFQGPRTHRIVPGAGHNLPQEAPTVFAQAVWELAQSALAQAGARPR